MSRISFILHGKHRNNKQLVNNLKAVFDSDNVLTFHFTEYSGHAIELARQAALFPSNFIIAAGGDGTLNEVANGIMLSGNKEVCAGLLPFGTGNDFARTMGITNSFDELKKLIDLNRIKEIDLGLMQFKNKDGQNASRYYINISDIGLGGYIAQKLDGSSKWLGAFITFQKAIISTFLTYKHKVVKIKADNFNYEGKILSCIVANGKYFGAGLGIAPEAELADGELAVVLGADISLWDYLMNLGKVRECLKIEHPQMRYYQTKEISIEGSELLPIDMDGEFIGFTPLQIKIVPKAIKILGMQ